MAETYAAGRRVPFNTRTLFACVVMPVFWLIGAIWLVDVPVIILGNFLFGAQMLSVMGLASMAVLLSRAVPIDHPYAGFITGMIWSSGIFALLHGFWMLYWGFYAMLLTPIATGNVPLFEIGPNASAEEIHKKMDDFSRQEGWLSKETIALIIIWVVFFVWMLPMEFANAVIRRGSRFTKAVREKQNISLFHWRSLLGGALMMAALVMSWRATMPGS